MDLEKGDKDGGPGPICFVQRAVPGPEESGISISMIISISLDFDNTLPVLMEEFK